MTTKMKALSIKQPFAWLIVNGHKLIENRTWRVPLYFHFGDKLAIHASKKFDHAGYGWVKDTFPGLPMPQPEEFVKGALVGEVDLIHCFTKDDFQEHVVIKQAVGEPSPLADYDTRWFTGPFGWFFANPVAYQVPIPRTGYLGLFRVTL